MQETLYTSDRFDSLVLDGSFLGMSIDQLKHLRPDITDLDLALAAMRRGRDFVTVLNGVIQRGYHA